MPFPACVPELTDGVVRLRAHRPGDASRIVEQCTDPDTLAFTTVPRPYGPRDAADFLDLVAQAWADESGHRYWAVCAPDDPEGAFLGTVDLRPRGSGTAETGFSLHPDGRGRRLMGRALRLACQWWFDQGGRWVGWTAVRGNFASLRVAHACGFRLEGTRSGSLPLTDEGPLLDAWLGSLRLGDPMTPRNRWIEPPVCELLGVRLRPWREDDARYVEPPDHPAHWIPSRAVPTPETFADWLLRRREVMARGESVNWCIADTRSDAALGEVLVFTGQGALADVDTAELGYQLFPSVRGRGVTRTAARMAIAHAFEAAEQGGLGLERLVARTAADNAASNRVLGALGFTRWGRESAAGASDGRDAGTDHWELGRPRGQGRLVGTGW